MPHGSGSAGRWHRWRARLAAVLGVACGVAAGMLGLPGAVAAQPLDEMSGRVGRIADLQGEVRFHDDAQGRWVEAWRNRAVGAGDRIATDRGARAQIGIGSTELRLDGMTEIEFERLDDQRIIVRLHTGHLAVRVRGADVAREIEWRAGDVRAWPLRVGHYRADREDGVVLLTAWRGSLGVDTRDQRLTVDAARSVELYRPGRDGTAVTWGGVAQDPFSDWVARDEQRDDRHAPAARHVSPEMTGADELDRHGRWERHPEFGIVWVPVHVAVGWAPYRHGRWFWHARWGWTWVDDAPWGFAVSHYGRWAPWRGHWCWVPGAYVARPAFAPALVGWVGSIGPGFGFSVSIGTPTVGWFPLAPREVYVPPFRYPPHYFDRVNRPIRPGVPPQVPTGPISYGNQGVPNAVTVVPSDVLTNRQPVAPAAMPGDDGRRRIGRDPRQHPAQVQVPGKVPMAPVQPPIAPVQPPMAAPAMPGVPGVPGVPAMPPAVAVPAAPAAPAPVGAPPAAVPAVAPLPRAMPLPPMAAPPAAEREMPNMRRPEAPRPPSRLETPRPVPETPAAAPPRPGSDAPRMAPPRHAPEAPRMAAPTPAAPEPPRMAPPRPAPEPPRVAPPRPAPEAPRAAERPGMRHEPAPRDRGNLRERQERQ